MVKNTETLDSALPKLNLTLHPLHPMSWSPARCAKSAKTGTPACCFFPHRSEVMLFLKKKKIVYLAEPVAQKWSITRRAFDAVGMSERILIIFLSFFSFHKKAEISVKLLPCIMTALCAVCCICALWSPLISHSRSLLHFSYALFYQSPPLPPPAIHNHAYIYRGWDCGPVFISMCIFC